MKRKLRWAVPLLAITLLVAACGSTGHSSAASKSKAANGKLQSKIYQVHNNVEFNNYNKRQQVADDPTTILWCTVYPVNPNVKPFTVPIQGKLTSSAKRPYATAQVPGGGNNSGVFTSELPGPDHMFGTSAEYRYGFTPAGVYWDFTGLETVCSTQPSVYQATQTQIVLTTDNALANAASQATAALKAGQNSDGTIDPAAGQKAQQILQAASGNK